MFQIEVLLTEKSDEDLEVWVAEVVFTASSRNVVGFGNSLGEVLGNLNFAEAQVGDKLRADVSVSVYVIGRCRTDSPGGW